jgi:hypothetical protein
MGQHVTSQHVMAAVGVMNSTLGCQSVQLHASPTVVHHLGAGV